MEEKCELENAIELVKKNGEEYLYGFECIRDGMQALKLVQRALYDMGGAIISDLGIKKADCSDQDGTRGLSISVELFFSPRLLREYIAQHPVPEECNGLAWHRNQEP